MNLRALVVDDEELARRRVSRLLEQHGGVDVVGECGDGGSAVESILTLTPDVVFLDVQMPEFDGFEVVQTVGPKAMPATVFVTAFDEYALRAFDTLAVDYLLKPVDATHIARAIERVRGGWRTRNRDDRLLALIHTFLQERRYLRRFPVRTEGRVLIVPADNVDWISTADNYVTLHVGRQEFLVRGTMAWLAGELDPEVFVRIHRRTIVRIDRVREIVPESHGDFSVRLTDGTALSGSRRFRASVERLFNL